MSYCADLSKHLRNPKLLWVGWLDVDHPFETAKPPKWVIEKLWNYCEYSLVPAGGFHECNLSDCSGPFRKLKIKSGRKRLNAQQLEKEHVSRREAFQTTRLSRLSDDHKKELLADFEQLLKSERRGYSRMMLAVHPGTGQQIDLGFAEIRVFGENGKVYAAPNMLYHYVTDHHYKPPAEFINALRKGPSPPAPEYFDRLESIGF